VHVRLVPMNECIVFLNLKEVGLTAADIVTLLGQ
jgi:uncharacterized protein YciW